MSYRKPDYMRNRFGQIVKCHADYPRTEAIERFMKMTERVLSEDDYCIVFTGGARFRVNDKDVTTPARFVYQALTGEILDNAEYLIRTCPTFQCCRLAHRERRKWLK